MAFTSFGGGIGGHLHWIEGKETTIDKEKEIKTEKMVMSQAEKNDNEKIIVKILESLEKLEKRITIIEEVK